MSAQLEPRRFNVTEYYKMAKAGILKPDDRVELIEGEIIKMSAIGSPHAACVSRLVRLLSKAIGDTAILSPQNPVRLDDFSEPVPDIALLKPLDDYYAARHPTPIDALLVIEVADSSLLKDRNVKVPLYARAGISEVWLVNLSKETIEVYSEALNGKYRKCRKFKRGEVVKSSTVKGLALKVNEILG
jgi:Uma2 family endonuclease